MMKQLTAISFAITLTVMWDGLCLQRAMAETPRVRPVPLDQPASGKASSGTAEGHGETHEAAYAAALAKVPPKTRVIRAAYAGSESGGWTCQLKWSRN